MAKPTKLSASFNGQTFTRSTHRTYTHVVIGRSNKTADLEYMRRQAEFDATANWAYYTREAGENPQFTHSPQELERFRSIVALGRDGYRAKLIADGEARIEARDYSQYHLIGWCGRPDLAQKEAAKAQAHGALDVQTLPVAAA